jgi:hypothetical protein
MEHRVVMPASNGVCFTMLFCERRLQAFWQSNEMASQRNGKLGNKQASKIVNRRNGKLTKMQAIQMDR